MPLLLHQRHLAPYKKKGEESGGVIAMIDTESEREGKLAQKEYEELIADSAEKCPTDSKSVADKEALMNLSRSRMSTRQL